MAIAAWVGAVSRVGALTHLRPRLTITDDDVLAFYEVELWHYETAFGDAQLFAAAVSSRWNDASHTQEVVQRHRDQGAELRREYPELADSLGALFDAVYEATADPVGPTLADPGHVRISLIDIRHQNA